MSGFVGGSISQIHSNAGPVTAAHYPWHADRWPCRDPRFRLGPASLFRVSPNNAHFIALICPSTPAHGDCPWTIVAPNGATADGSWRGDRRWCRRGGRTRYGESRLLARIGRRRWRCHRRSTRSPTLTRAIRVLQGGARYCREVDAGGTVTPRAFACRRMLNRRSSISEGLCRPARPQPARKWAARKQGDAHVKLRLVGQ